MPAFLRWPSVSAFALLAQTVVVACGSSGAAGDAGPGGCPPGQMRCASCQGAGFCSPACPEYACPAFVDSGADDGGPGYGDGGCPPTSTTSCIDCNGGVFCVSGSCPETTCPASLSPEAGSTVLPPAPADAGAAFVAIYDKCAGATPKPLTAGSWTEPRSGTTLHWPTGWTQAPSTSLGGATEPYTYVPTGMTAAVSSNANVSISPSIVSSDTQAQQVLQSAAQYAQSNGGSASSVTISGHPAVLWWDKEPPPQPGCLNCPGDPGPDFVNVGLTVFLGNDPDAGGLTVVDVTGSARIDAVPADIFCDMAEMALGVTFSM